MKIVEIIRSGKNAPFGVPSKFRVGNAIVEGGHTVSEILYCRDGYNSGSKGKWPCYAIKFIETKEVRVIPESEIIDMAILPDEDVKKNSVKSEANIELPD
jgi:hypothetical protein